MTTQDKTDFIENKMEDLDNMGLPDECVAMVRGVVEELADEAEAVDLASKDLAVAREMLDAKDAEIAAMAKTLAERDALCEQQTRTIHGIPALMRERNDAIAAKKEAGRHSKHLDSVLDRMHAQRDAAIAAKAEAERERDEATLRIAHLLASRDPQPAIDTLAANLTRVSALRHEAESREHALGVQVVALQKRLALAEAVVDEVRRYFAAPSFPSTRPMCQALAAFDAVPGDVLATCKPGLQVGVDYREASGVDVERVSVPAYAGEDEVTP